VQGEEALQTADEIALNRVDAAFCRLPRTRRYSDGSPAADVAYRAPRRRLNKRAAVHLGERGGARLAYRVPQSVRFRWGRPGGRFVLGNTTLASLNACTPSLASSLFGLRVIVWLAHSKNSNRNSGNSDRPEGATGKHYRSIIGRERVEVAAVARREVAIFRAARRWCTSAITFRTSAIENSGIAI